jgi:TRAP-type C4-dicarboxylate transport system permease small subunit
LRPEPDLHGSEGRIAAEAATAAPSLGRAGLRGLGPLRLAGCVLLFGTMAVTCFDVVGRYFLNAPLPGGFELTEVMMAGLIFFGLPLVTARNEHITVDLLDLVASPRMRWWQEVFADLVCGGMTALLAWTLWVKAGQVASYADRTEVLHIPLTPIAYLMCAMMALSAAIFLGKLGARLTSGSRS